jgi:hypothetical protein
MYNEQLKRLKIKEKDLFIQGAERQRKKLMNN